MKRHRPIKRPDCIVVRDTQYVIMGSLAHWRESRLRELSCDRCGQPLVVVFAARNNLNVTPQDDNWWKPNGITCSCLLPKAAELIELPKRPRRPKQDARQLEFQT